jgi:stringent starvation protein B
MLSQKPYLLRAIYEWIVDDQCTPYVMVNAELPNVDVPREFIKDGKIVFNLSPASVKKLQISNDELYFKARFSGVDRKIYVPMQAVTAIYAMENGQGMVFEEDLISSPEDSDKSPSGSDEGHLHLVD